jgi:mTERF domain-containing protein
MLATKPEHIRAIVARAEAIGVPRGSRMFRHAMQAVAFLSEKDVTIKVEY